MKKTVSVHTGLGLSKSERRRADAVAPDSSSRTGIEVITTPPPPLVLPPWARYDGDQGEIIITPPSGKRVRIWVGKLFGNENAVFVAGDDKLSYEALFPFGGTLTGE